MRASSAQGTLAIALSALAGLLAWASPARAECTADSECKAGRRCVEGTCADPPAAAAAGGCSTHEDCPVDRVCRDGQCVSPMQPPAAAKCTQDADCAGGEICEQGLCKQARAAVAPARRCTGDSDCAGGEVCAQSVCTQARAALAAPAPPPAAPPAASPAPSAPPPPPAVSDGAPPPAFGPDSYRTETKGVTGLIIAGAVLLPLGYVAAIAVTGAMAGADQAEGEDVGLAAIPLAGSWISMVNAIENSSADTGWYAPLAVSGGLQVTGTLLLVLGLSIRTEERVPVYASRTDGRGTVLVAPTIGPGGTGIAAVGTF